MLQIVRPIHVPIIPYKYKNQGPSRHHYPVLYRSYILAMYSSTLSLFVPFPRCSIKRKCSYPSILFTSAHTPSINHVPTPSFLASPSFLFLPATSYRPFNLSKSSLESFFSIIRSFKNLFSSSSSCILPSSLANCSFFSLLFLSSDASRCFFLARNLADAAVLRSRLRSASASVMGEDGPPLVLDVMDDGYAPWGRA
jgi:hypothetical protein